MCARVLCGGCGGSRPIVAGSQKVRRRRSRLAPLRPFALCPRRAAPPHPPPAPPMPPRLARRIASSLSPFCPLAARAEWSACVPCGGCGSGATTRTSAPDDALDCRHRSHASRTGYISSNWIVLVDARHFAEVRAVNGCTAALWTWIHSCYFVDAHRTTRGRDRPDPKVESARKRNVACGLLETLCRAD